MRTALPCVFALLITSVVIADEPELMTETIEYRHGDTVLEGFMVYDINREEASLPGVLVVHEWWGHDDFAREQAKRIARLGYVAFALDMYGKGVHADERDQASRLAGRFYADDFALMRERARAGYDVLANHWRTDSDRLAVMGFCFGGTVSLQLAYSGAPLRAAVGIHGSLPPPRESDDENITASILVLHGAVDPFVPREQVDAFRKAMQRAGADWQLIEYGGAVHSFTNPAADDYGIDGAAYHEDAARRSWLHLKQFLRERLRDD